MPETDLRHSIKEMLVKNLMLQTTAQEIGDDLPLFGPGGLGLDSIDALELVVSMEKTFGVGVPNSEVAAKALRTVNTIHDYIVENDLEKMKILFADVSELEQMLGEKFHPRLPVTSARPIEQDYRNDPGFAGLHQR